MRRAPLLALAFLPACAFALALAEGSYRAALFLARRLAPARGGVFELYAIGESSMQGEPFQRAGLSPALTAAKVLGGEVKGRPIVVRNLAMTGESIYVQERRLRLAVSYRRRDNPGTVLIYSGNNDSGASDGGPPPASPGALFGAVERRFLRRSFVLSDLLYFARRRLGFQRDSRWRSYESFLRRAGLTALENGLTPVFSTVVSNVADVEPAVREEAWDASLRDILAHGLALESARRWNDAAAAYRKGLDAAQPCARPVFLFRTAACLRAQGRRAEARELLWRAVDGDCRSRFGRATRAQNDAVRRVAAELGAPLLDAAALFEERSPSGLLGDELLGDFHHPNLEGAALLGFGFARELAKSVGAPLPAKPFTGPELRLAFGLSDQDMADAEVLLGGNLLRYACSFRPWPEQCLGSAGRRFRAALGYSMRDARAWLGLAVVESAGAEAAPGGAASPGILYDTAALEKVVSLLWDESLRGEAVDERLRAAGGAVRPPTREMEWADGLAAAGLSGASFELGRAWIGAADGLEDHALGFLRKAEAAASEPLHFSGIAACLDALHRPKEAAAWRAKKPPVPAPRRPGKAPARAGDK